MARGLSILLAALLLTACASLFVSEFSERGPEVLPDPVYEELFPTYVEVCALTQFRSLVFGEGGIPGHGVMYLKGACADAESPYPKLRRCHRAATRRDDPEHGAGISVNRWFRNVNWIAVPGTALFYEGGLEPGEPVTQAAFDATVREALDRGVFRGVELRDYPTDAEERSLEDFAARHSAATDFALRFGRSVMCARLPVTSEMLDEVMDFLNDLNREYATGAADYDWSGYHDNCVHTVHNALAAASVWKPVSVRVVKLRQLFNLAVPANAFVDLAWLGARGPIDDLGAVYGYDPARNALLEFGWLPTRHGALVTLLPIHAPNQLYDTTARIFVQQRPWSPGATRKASELFEDPAATQLVANLERFREIYAEIAGDEDPESWLSGLRGDRYRLVRRRHRRYAERQLEEVDAMLGRLSD